MNLRSLLKFDLAMQSMSWTASSDGVDEITAMKSCSTEIVGGCDDGADGRGDVEDVRGEVEVFCELDVAYDVGEAAGNKEVVELPGFGCDALESSDPAAGSFRVDTRDMFPCTHVLGDEVSIDESWKTLYY